MGRVGVLSGEWEMNCSKCVVWGILIITTATGTLSHDAQPGSETSERGSTQVQGTYWGAPAAL